MVTNTEQPIEIARRNYLSHRRRHGPIGAWLCRRDGADGLDPAAADGDGASDRLRPDCAPEKGETAEEFQNAHTTASGLRSQKRSATSLIIDASGHQRTAQQRVTDEELISATKEIDRRKEFSCAPEGAACLPALKKLLSDGAVKSKSGWCCSIPEWGWHRRVFRDQDSRLRNVQEQAL
jgi:hypothetical protein